jgi:hypothetical protein
VNPIAVIALAIGVILVVIGFKGHQDNTIAALTGKPYGKSTLQ